MRRGEGLPEPEGNSKADTVNKQWSLALLTCSMMTVYNATADVRYPGVSGDFDQRVHLIKPATIFLRGYVAQTDCVCVLVGKKFDFAPHR